MASGSCHVNDDYDNNDIRNDNNNYDYVDKIIN